MSQQTKKNKDSTSSLPILIMQDLRDMKLGEQTLVETFVSKHWTESTLFTRRSFDVYYCRAKNLLMQEGIFFKRSKGTITKISNG